MILLLSIIALLLAFLVLGPFATLGVLIMLTLVWIGFALLLGLCSWLAALDRKWDAFNARVDAKYGWNKKSS